MPSFDRPDELPRFASVDGTDAISGQANVVEPPDSKKDTGWHYREKPPRNWLNWLHRKVYEWVAFIDEQRTEGQRDFQPNAFDAVPTVSAPGGLVADVSGPHEVWLNGDLVSQAAAAGVVLADNQTNYVYLDSDGVYKSSTVSDTAFAATRVPVARVITSGGAVTRIDSLGRTTSHDQMSITVGPNNADFTSLQRAVNFAESIRAGLNARVEIVVVGDPTPSASVIIRSAVKIRGAGPAERISWSFDTGPLFSLQSPAGFCVFEDLFFDYAGPAVVSATHAAIAAQGTDIDGVEVSRCFFNGVQRGIHVHSGATTNRWAVEGCRFSMPSATAPYAIGSISGATLLDWIISGNHLQGQTGANSAVGIDLVGAARPIIAGNNFDGWDRAIRIDATSSRAKVLDNVIVRPRRIGIESDASGSSITGNGVYDSGADAGVQDGAIRIPTTAGTRQQLAGNDVRNWKSGFAISCAIGEVQVNNNLCVQTTGTSSTPALSGGIAVQASDAQVQGNYIDMLQGAALNAGKRNCYGVKLGLFGSGPAVAFTANGADRCIVSNNMIRNVGDGTEGGVGIDCSTRTVCDGNRFQNVSGLGIRVEGADGSVSGNVFEGMGFGPLAAPYGAASAYLGFASGGDRANVLGNVGRNPASAAVASMNFESGAVGNRLRNNQLQVGSGFASAPFPVGYQEQDFGDYYVTGQTVGNVIVNLTPGLKFAATAAEYAVSAEVSGDDAAANNGVAYRLLGAVAVDGAGTPTVNAQAQTIAEGAGLAAANASFTVVGGDLVVQVSGAAGVTLNWQATMNSERRRSNNFYS